MSIPRPTHRSANASPETCRDLLSGTRDGYLTQVSNERGLITRGSSVVATMRIPFVVLGGPLFLLVLRFWKLL